MAHVELTPDAVRQADRLPVLVGTVHLEDLTQPGEVLNITDYRLEMNVREQLSHLLLEMEECRFSNFKSDNGLRVEACDLPAQLRADRTSCSRHQHHLGRLEAPDLVFDRLDDVLVADPGLGDDADLGQGGDGDDEGFLCLLAGGLDTGLPFGLRYGPAQSLHVWSGRSVLPERVKHSSFDPSAVSPRQASVPQREMNLVSFTGDS